MLLGHLLCGIVLGVFVAGASFVVGFSLWATLLSFVLGANLGLGVSVLMPNLWGRSADHPRPIKVKPVILVSH